MPGWVAATWRITALLAWGGLVASLPGYYRWFVEQPVQQGFNAQGVAVAAASGLASLLSAVVSLGLGLLIYRRRPGDRAAAFVSFYLLLFGFAMSGPLEMVESLLTGQSTEVSYRVQGAVFPLLGFLLMLTFPNGIVTPAPFRWMIPPMVLLSIIPMFLPVADQMMLRTPLSRMLLALMSLAILSGFGAQVYRYLRVSSLLERQQTKIVLFGLFVQIVLMGMSSLNYYQQPEGAYNALLPEYLFSNLIWFVSLTVTPISLTVAVIRSHLWDIDVVIRRTLVYSTLTAALALVYFGSVIVFQYASRIVIGQESPAAVVLTTLIIAALFTPLRGAIQAVIDRRFYRSKYNAEHALARFQYTLREHVDLDQVERELVEIVQETVQPDWMAVWMRKQPDASAPAASGKTID